MATPKPVPSTSLPSDGNNADPTHYNEDTGYDLHTKPKLEPEIGQGQVMALSSGPSISVHLTYSPLSPTSAIDAVRSPLAGAILLFAGTTRSTFPSSSSTEPKLLPVLSLAYTAYVPLALRTLLAIARSVHEEHSLTGISITHRLGPVPVGEESILISVSSPHRKAAFRAGEQALEECKAKTEIWKLEVLGEDGEGQASGEGGWRANRDTDGEGRRLGDSR